MDKHFQTVIAFIFAIFSFMLGKADGMIYGLIALMTLDYISGIIIACIKKKLSSSIGFKGIMKKALILVMVSVGHIADTQLLKGGCICRSAVIGFYSANEGLSIIENAASIGLPMPRKLKSMLIQIREENEK